MQLWLISCSFDGEISLGVTDAGIRMRMDKEKALHVRMDVAGQNPLAWLMQVQFFLDCSSRVIGLRGNQDVEVEIVEVCSIDVVAKEILVAEDQVLVGVLDRHMRLEAAVDIIDSNGRPLGFFEVRMDGQFGVLVG